MQMRTLLAFTKQALEDTESPIQSPIGDDLREMLKGFHLELLRHSNHPPPEEDESAMVEDAAAANAQQVSWTERLLALIVSRQEEKQTGPITDGPGTYPGSIPDEGHLSRYVTSNPGQLSLANPSWAMSTSQRAVNTLRLGSKGRYGSRVGGR